MHARFTLAFLLLVVLVSASPLRAADKAPAEDLSKLIETALANNPSLKVSGSHVATLHLRAEQAGRLDDPMLMLKIQNGVVTDPLNFKKDSMTQKVIGISQQIPYFGKRDLKREIAEREADAYHLEHDERHVEVIRMVKETYYQIYMADRSLAILDKNIAILDSFITLAQTKYSVGQGAQQDVFKAQLERSRMLDMQISLRQQRRSLEIAMNSLLHRHPSAPIGAIPELALGAAPPDAEALMDMAEEYRPELRSMKIKLDKARSEHELAKKEYYPDFNVSFEYMQRNKAMGSDGSDMYSLGVTFNLPVQRERRQAMVAEASSEIVMAQEEINTARNNIRTGIADLLAQMDRRRQLVDLYKSGIIPQAEQSLESAVIGYRVNKVDFLTLLDSRVALFNYEREYYDSLADYRMKKAQLEALVGRELP